MSSYDEYRALITDLDARVRFFELHPDFTVRQQAVALLTALDALHRTGLERLADGLRDEGAGPALERAAADPIVRTLLGLYDLADLGLPAADTAGPVSFVLLDRLRQSRPGPASSAQRKPA